MGSIPIVQPKYPYGGIGIRSGLRSHTIIGSTPITGTIFGKVNYLSYIYFIRLIGNKDSPLNRVSANLINCHSVSNANHKSKCPRTHLLLSLDAQFD